MSKRIINNNAAIIFGLCALLLLSLVAYDRFLGVTKSGINGVDTFEYWMYANDILAGKYKTVCNRLSAYVINVLAFLIIGQNDYSIKMAVALFGVINTCLVLVMTYAYGRSAIAALCAAAAYAFLPTIQYYSKIELVHTYSATFVLGVFVALVWAVEARDLRKRALAVASAGFAAGLAALSHEDLLLVTVGAGIVLAFMPSDVAAADHVFALPRPRDLVRDAFAGAFGFFLAFAFCMGTLGVSPGQMISGFFTMRQIMDGQTQGALGQASVAKDLPRILNDFGPAALGWPVTLAVAALAAAAPLLRRARKLPAQAIRPLTIAAILVVTYAVLYILASNSYLAGSYGRIFVPFIGPLVIVSFAALVRVHRGGGR